MINKLREQINIEKPNKVPNKSGGFATEYELHAGPLWAEIKPAGGRERFFAQKLEMDITHKIVLRFDPDLKLKPNMRVVFESRIFKILFIFNRDERSRWLDLLCEEGSGS